MFHRKDKSEIPVLSDFSFLVESVRNALWIIQASWWRIWGIKHLNFLWNIIPFKFNFYSLSLSLSLSRSNFATVVFLRISGSLSISLAIHANANRTKDIKYLYQNVIIFIMACFHSLPVFAMWNTLILVVYSHLMSFRFSSLHTRSHQKHPHRHKYPADRTAAGISSSAR